MNTQTLFAHFTQFPSLLGLAWFDQKTQLLETNLIFSDEKVVELIKPVLNFFGKNNGDEDLILLEVESSTLAFSKQRNGIFVFHLNGPDEIEAVVKEAKSLPTLSTIDTDLVKAEPLPLEDAPLHRPSRYGFDKDITVVTHSEEPVRYQSRAKQLFFSSCAAVATIVLVGGAIGHSQAKGPDEMPQPVEEEMAKVEDVLAPTPEGGLVAISGFDESSIELSSLEPETDLPSADVQIQPAPEALTDENLELTEPLLPVSTAPVAANLTEEMPKATPATIVSKDKPVAKMTSRPKATKKKASSKKRTYKKSSKKKRTYTKKRSCNR